MDLLQRIFFRIHDSDLYQIEVYKFTAKSCIIVFFCKLNIIKIVHKNGIINIFCFLKSDAIFILLAIMDVLLTVFMQIMDSKKIEHHSSLKKLFHIKVIISLLLF